jgi:cell division protein FtsL
LLLGACIAAAFLLSHLAFAVVHVVAQGHEVEAKNRILEMDKARAQAEKKRKEQQIAWLNSPEGAEQAARSHGLVKPGERRVNFIVQTPKAAAAAQPDAPLTATEKTGLYATIGAVLLIVGTGVLLVRRARRRSRPMPGALTPRSALRRRSEPVSEV